MKETRFVCDGQVDLIYAMQRAGAGNFSGWQEGPVTPETLTSGKVDLLVNALYCADIYNGAPTAAPYLERLMNFAEKRLDGLRRVGRGTELPDAGSGETATVFLLENGDSLIEADLDRLEAWDLRLVGLTHRGKNRLGDGSDVVNPGGLTDRGRNLLRELAERRWAIDLAYLAEPGFREVVATYPGPLLISQTGLRPFCDQPRNLTQDQLAALAERGGLIGLSLAPKLLTGKHLADLEDVVEQLDWLAERIGPEFVALGSGYGDFHGVCLGLEDYSCWPRLAAALKGRGWAEVEVRGVLGENWRRFYAALL